MPDPITWTIHAVIDDGEPPMFAIVPNDYSNGYLVGEMAEVESLTARLYDFVQDGQHDGEIDDLHPSLHTWLTVSQAAERYDVPHSTITWACRQGRIHKAEKMTRWTFPERAFRHWLMKRRDK